MKTGKKPKTPALYLIPAASPIKIPKKTKFLKLVSLTVFTAKYNAQAKKKSCAGSCKAYLDKVIEKGISKYIKRPTRAYFFLANFLDTIYSGIPDKTTNIEFKNLDNK